jgi:DNA replication protein DnaC
MEGRLLARARARQEEIRSANRAEETARQEEIARLYPEIRQIGLALRGHMHELVGLALGRPGRPAEELERENLDLQAKRRELLRKAGYPEDYLDPIYSCPLCRDTGWVGEKMCDCLLRLYKQEQTAELAPLLRNGDETFDAFRLDYYSPAAAPGEKGSPRDQMRRVLQTCKAYARDFGPDSPNLLFTGAPGLGKTFLSAAIARVVAAKGAGVAYDTVTPLLTAFERERFSRDTDEQADAASRVRQLLACDLLILDDLGTEMATAFTQSALYNLLDSRLRAGKKTVISTNLDRDGIFERYGAALASRLTGEYEWLEFRGRDIRAVRKELR